MKSERTLICIGCPIGCELHVIMEEGVPAEITGYTCPRGKEYAYTECTHPVRTLTSTVKTDRSTVVPVKTDRPIPKEKLFCAMKEINEAVAHCPVSAGDVIISGIAGTDANLVATAEAN